ncbi:MAG TPA: hypothetical protein VKR24_00040 [Candidatus Limnocylindrales bacterium]|nr:hypothetical protein [Candidatus Limnocylindrales bacterium]
MKQEWPSITRPEPRSEPEPKSKHPSDPRHDARQPDHGHARQDGIRRRLEHPDAENANWDAAEKQGEPGQEVARKTPR